MEVGVEIIKGSKEYYLEEVESDEVSIDPDNTQKAENFYEEMWDDSYKKDSICCRGETIISFNTMAGVVIRLYDLKMPSNDDKRIDIILDSDKIPAEIKSKFEKFYHLYHSRANFMPLPYCLNTARGKFHNDCMSSFLEEVRNHCIKGKVEKLKIIEKCDCYFSTFSENEQGWKNYVEANYLQDLLTEDDGKYLGDFVELRPKGLPYTIRTSYNTADCVKKIVCFLDTAIEIIEKRAERLSDAYNKKLKKGL